jgi:hypothetical protein
MRFHRLLQTHHRLVIAMLGFRFVIFQHSRITLFSVDQELRGTVGKPECAQIEPGVDA